MLCFLKKNAKLTFWRIKFSWIIFLANLRLQVTCMTHLIRKTLKLLNFPKNQNFMKIRKNAFSVKLPTGYEIVLNVNSGQKDVSFITIIGKAVSCETSKGHSASKIFHLFCTFPVSAVTFELPIKQNRCMIEFFANSKLCLDSAQKSRLDLIANGSVTLDISKFINFVCLTKIQCYTPLSFNAFVPKLILVYLKAISQNPIKNQNCMLIKMRNSLLSSTSEYKVCIIFSLSQYIMK